MNHNYFNGLRIVENPLLEPEPKIQLSPAAPVSDGFRSEFNSWLLEKFGFHDAKVIVSELHGVMFCAPSVAKRLREAICESPRR
jgi:hypothetical protein